MCGMQKVTRFFVYTTKSYSSFGNLRLVKVVETKLFSLHQNYTMRGMITFVVKPVSLLCYLFLIVAGKVFEQPVLFVIAQRYSLGNFFNQFTIKIEPVFNIYPFKFVTKQNMVKKCTTRCNKFPNMTQVSEAFNSLVSNLPVNLKFV